MRGLRGAVALMALVLAACGGSYTAPSNTSGGGGGGGGGGSAPNAISVRDDIFTPSSTTVAVGTTVTWTWGGYNAHDVTFDNTQLGNSPTQVSGTYAKTFTTAGVFAYHCTQHAGMNGTVTVQ